jgi:FkbM family methyltransferase
MLRYARQGLGIRGKVLLFLLATFGSLARSRAGLRKLFFRGIGCFGDGQYVAARFNMHGHSISFTMRQNNEADYLIGCELVKGGYDPPNFEPEQIVDGGANIGLFSIVAGAMFPRAALVCFEPNPSNFEQLRRNLADNNLTAECHRLGLWSKETTLHFHERLSHTGFISESPSGVAIQCTVPEIRRNCWLKLDVETAEYEVLPALLNSGKYPRWISMEIHHYSERGHLLTELLRGHGYSILGGDDKSAEYVNISAWRNPD